MTEMDDEEPDELLGEIERRALFAMPDEEEADEEAVDLVAELRGTGEVDRVAGDATLGGYIAKHDRVPAFEGPDGQPYTVDIDVEPSDGPEPWAAFVVFIRWAATGAGIMDHCESGDVAYGATEEEARGAALDLTLFEIKAELDAAVERRHRAMED